MDILIRSNEACAAEPFLLWDSIWNPLTGQADWALADLDERLNIGGLRAKQGIATAVVLCLFTDKRLPDGHPLADLVDGDPRGWWGDGIDVRTDLGETELGSLLWLLERAPLTPATARWAQQFANEALAPLKSQGVVVRVDCSAVAVPAEGRIELTVNLYGRDGAKVYSQRFEDLWKRPEDVDLAGANDVSALMAIVGPYGMQAMAGALVGLSLQPFFDEWSAGAGRPS